MSKVNPFIRTTALYTHKSGWNIKAEAIFIEDEMDWLADIQKVEHIVDYRKNWSNGREMTRYENHERAALGLANRFEFEFDSMDGKTNSTNDGYHFKLK